MAVKTATLTLTGGDMRFEAQVGSGHTIVMDNGEGDTGARPAELVGVALAGCTGMDVISILRKKRQAVTAYEIRAEGVQVEQHPHNFTRFDVTHVVSGDDIDEGAVRRAVELSATKYCSVGSTLSSGALEAHHHYIVRAADGAELASGEVLVTGPNESPEELAGRA
jgi:putative redox protein